MEDVVATGKGFAINNQQLLLNRNGRLEETFWTYSFGPVRGEKGAIVGILLTAMDTTIQVIAERRQAFLLQLELKLRSLSGPFADSGGPPVRRSAAHCVPTRLGTWT